MIPFVIPTSSLSPVVGRETRDEYGRRRLVMANGTSRRTQPKVKSQTQKIVKILVRGRSYREGVVFDSGSRD